MAQFGQRAADLAAPYWEATSFSGFSINGPLVVSGSGSGRTAWFDSANNWLLPGIAGWYLMTWKVAFSGSQSRLTSTSNAHWSSIQTSTDGTSWAQRVLGEEVAGVAPTTINVDFGGMAIVSADGNTRYRVHVHSTQSPTTLFRAVWRVALIAVGV